MAIGAVNTFSKWIPPVGAIITTSSSVSPAADYAGTSWAQIKDRFLMGAGGSYTLYFSTYNAGRLEVMTAADAAMAAGVFGKEPGQSSIEFIYSGRDYVGTVSSYTDSEGVRKVLLAVDLTEEYRKLHPEVNITKAERLEYTSTNAY